MRIVASLLVLVNILCCHGQNFDSACASQKQALAIIRKYHYSPPPDIAQTRKEIVDLYIRNVDEKNLFFLKSDVEALEASCEDGPLSDVTCTLARLSFRLISTRIRQLDSLSDLLAKRHLVFDGLDTIKFVYHQRERVYGATLSDLEQRMERRIKYDCLQTALNNPGLLAAASPLREEPVAVPLKDYQPRAVRKLRRGYSQLSDTNALLTHINDCLIDAVARRCDPHSAYLNRSDLGKYRRSLSNQEQSFGFSLAENKTGETVLSDIVPGGPAWKNDVMEEGDVLAALADGTGNTWSTAELSVSELMEKLEDPALPGVTLSLIKKNGERRQVSLSKERIVSMDNSLCSFVVTDKGRRMGFIPLPSFYLDQDNDPRNGCASDVAREIIELRNDSVEGIIIDLRFNGGGSMREAMALAGLFINEGPVAIYRQRDEKPFLLKDMHRGTVWDGPVLILINAASASAAEFVTATLQDYNRAVVAGSGSFGKGTAQNLVTADTTAGNGDAGYFEGSGVLKITAGKFYRVSAQSHQAKGIQPDVQIPGIIDKVLEREAAYPFHMTYDTLDKAASIYRLPALPINDLREKSAHRIASHGRFTQIARFGDSLQAITRNVEKIPLSIFGYRHYSERQKRMSYQMETLFNEEDPGISIRHNSANEQVIAQNSFLARNSAKTISRLKQDITFQESVHIMTDLLELKSK